MSTTLGHLLFALALILAYVGLSVAGHDASPLLAVLVGQGAAIGIAKTTTGNNGSA